jgi:hypothetical protein
VPPEQLAPLEEQATAAGVAVTRLGLATGARVVVKGLVDVDLASTTTTWRRRLPDTLGQGTTQG